MPEIKIRPAKNSIPIISLEMNGAVVQEPSPWSHFEKFYGVELCVSGEDE
ncbi:hypothetical protein RCC89_20780 [Cytophagaceae bacterium ABcell3]|nr:hypothetical protein RCC89_20780 [Cytophagaceae bacterium ABcell3]